MKEVRQVQIVEGEGSMDNRFILQTRSTREEGKNSFENSAVFNEMTVDAAIEAANNFLKGV